MKEKLKLSMPDGVKEAGALTENHCKFWHRWRPRKPESINHYSECIDCGSRRVTAGSSCYQPIDFDWLVDALKQRNYQA